MKNRTEFKSIKNFLFQKDKTFIIPNYQRGYKWAVKENNKQSAVEKLIEDLRNANKQQEYFLQGVTVSEEDNKIILIDGQQRTTTLYLLLWALKYEKFKEINLQYDIREKSKEFINKLKEKEFDYKNYDKENEIQDVFYFKEAIKQIKTEIEKVEDSTEFLDFILNKVTIIYIVIDKDKATKTFTMMNGAKATMLQEELVKAEMLRRISIPEEDKQVFDIDKVNLSEIELGDLKEIITKDWETNALRSRYAREWDKWLYWWNRNDVKEYFNIKSPMGLLLDYFYKRKNKGEFSFDNFKGLITENKKTGKQKTKLIFKELRDLQKSFEDIFSAPKTHNYLKLSLICSNDKEDKYKIINFFINNKKDEKLLANYSKWRLVGATHKQITSDNLSENEETKEDKAQIALNKFLDDFVYQNAFDLALKQLLRLNVEEDNKLFEGKGRKFDFTIYGNKSLEHIHPKSKVYHKNEAGELVDGNDNPIDEDKINRTNGIWLDRSDFNGNGTEHCIGNLVLLDKNENSKFNDKPFAEKKEIYFDVNEVFKSRNLLHTISVFAKSKWGIDEIQNNKNEFIERFKKDYNIKD